ncbi:hypothetical protein Kpho01_67120 [Kitasatospora phosalacinea]|uniref:Uncharacterized protein n=1 Tax=Kitasatospora phosalacinea TaxID=2065 RepID=A0A9W6PPC1_9ACTN|nr:hypothetical protein Kpho01_67120 [Kitasatospora phosalacinea]
MLELRVAGARAVLLEQGFALVVATADGGTGSVGHRVLRSTGSWADDGVRRRPGGVTLGVAALRAATLRVAVRPLAQQLPEAAPRPVGALDAGVPGTGVLHDGVPGTGVLDVGVPDVRVVRRIGERRDAGVSGVEHAAGRAVGPAVVRAAVGRSGGLMTGHGSKLFN